MTDSMDSAGDMPEPDAAVLGRPDLQPDTQGDLPLESDLGEDGQGDLDGEERHSGNAPGDLRSDAASGPVGEQKGAPRMSDIDQGMMPPHVRPRQPDDDEVDEKAANPRAADDDEEQNKPPVPRRIAAEQDVEAELGEPGSETR